MLSMLYPMNRADAKWDFMRYSAETSTDIGKQLKDVKNGKIVKKWDEKYESSFKCFSRKYPKFRDIESSLSWYTR